MSRPSDSTPADDDAPDLAVYPTNRALVEQERLRLRAQVNAIRPLSKTQAEVAGEVVTLNAFTGDLSCTCGVDDCWHVAAVRDRAVRRIPRNL